MRPGEGSNTETRRHLSRLRPEVRHYTQTNIRAQREEEERILLDLCSDCYDRYQTVTAELDKARKEAGQERKQHHKIHRTSPKFKVAARQAADAKTPTTEVADRFQKEIVSDCEWRTLRQTRREATSRRRRYAVKQRAGRRRNGVKHMAGRDIKQIERSKLSSYLYDVCCATNTMHEEVVSLGTSLLIGDISVVMFSVSILIRGLRQRKCDTRWRYYRESNKIGRPARAWLVTHVGDPCGIALL